MYDLNTTAYWRKAKAVVLAVFFFGACEGCEPTIVEPEYDACPNLAGIQAEVPEGMVKDSAGNCVPKPVPSLWVFFESPLWGTVVKQNRTFPCPKLRITSANIPAGAHADTIFSVNGQVFICGTLAGGSTPELVSGSPPARASSSLPLGDVMLRAEVRYSAENITATDSVLVRVVPEPGTIVYTWVKATYPAQGPRVFCTLDDDGLSPPVCQTSEANKYWPMLTPDGQSWVYSKLDFSGLWFSERDGSGERVVSTKYQGISHSVEFPVFSPSGQKIAFVGGASNDQGFYAFVMNANGTDITPVHGDCGGFGVPYIVWLNEHEVVIGCTTWVGDTRMSEYRKVNILSGGHKRLQLFPRFGHEASGARILDASADGSVALLWTVFLDARVVLLKTDGSGEYTKITPPTPDGKGDYPFFCQSGRAICYQYGPALFAMDLDGGNGREIVRLPFGWIETARRWK